MGNAAYARGSYETRDEAFAALDRLPREVRQAVTLAPYQYHVGSILRGWTRLSAEAGASGAASRICRRLTRVSRLEVIAAYGSRHPEAR
jgi:hypothetical protein